MEGTEGHGSFNKRRRNGLDCSGHLGLLTAVVLVLLLLSSSKVESSIHEYKNGAFVQQSNAFFFNGGSEGLYASKVHDANSSGDHKPFNGRSFIRFDGVSFVRTKEAASKYNEMQQSSAVVEAILLEAKDKKTLGGAFWKSNVLCCDLALINSGSCKQGDLIMHKNPDSPNWPKRIKASFTGKNLEAKMENEEVEVNSTGMYYIYFVFCNPELKGTLINGRTVWKNPDGYLPGNLSPMMTFYDIMSLAYTVLGFVWFLKFVRFWDNTVELHNYIFLVIAFGRCEMAVWSIEYANLNLTGLRPMGIMLLTITTTLVRKTLSRLVLLLLSMGYGVVKPTLGGTHSKVLLMGLVYFAASAVFELVIHLENINDFSKKTLLFLVLPVAFLDSCFILWISSSLLKTLEQLQMSRNMAKLELYWKFAECLVVCALLSVAWKGFELYVTATDPLSELWQVDWIIPAFWTLLTYFLLAVVCILWVPSRNPTRYAYSEGGSFLRGGYFINMEWEGNYRRHFNKRCGSIF